MHFYTDIYTSLHDMCIESEQIFPDYKFLTRHAFHTVANASILNVYQMDNNT